MFSKGAKPKQQDSTPHPSSAFSIPADARLIFEGILEDAGLDDLNPNVVDGLVEELFLQYDSYLNAVLLEKMSEQDQDKYFKLIDRKRPQHEIEQFLTSAIPDLAPVVLQASADFKARYVND